MKIGTKKQRVIGCNHDPPFCASGKKLSINSILDNASDLGFLVDPSSACWRVCSCTGLVPHVATKSPAVALIVITCRDPKHDLEHPCYPIFLYHPPISLGLSDVIPIVIIRRERTDVGYSILTEPYMFTYSLCKYTLVVPGQLSTNFAYHNLTSPDPVILDRFGLKNS
ncbi:unnamed protein product [Hymenolepis diminuta]|uniref:Uncharacterized protein n=1 Tax=Hymenolepis diminuta TaxID=6216 RepID=A0A564YTI5_HYMDI|nr:unnamed protein product [Hymenolepis diminuta]